MHTFLLIYKEKLWACGFLFANSLQVLILIMYLLVLCHIFSFAYLENIPFSLQSMEPCYCHNDYSWRNGYLYVKSLRKCICVKTIYLRSNIWSVLCYLLIISKIPIEIRLLLPHVHFVWFVEYIYIIHIYYIFLFIPL